MQVLYKIIFSKKKEKNEIKGGSSDILWSVKNSFSIFPLNLIISSLELKSK